MNGTSGVLLIASILAVLAQAFQHGVAAKLPHIMIHDLRRSATRELMRGGEQQAVVKLISGHKSDAVVSRHNVVSTEQVRAGTKRRERNAKLMQSLSDSKKYVPVSR